MFLLPDLGQVTSQPWASMFLVCEMTWWGPKWHSEALPQLNEVIYAKSLNVPQTHKCLVPGDHF